MRCRDASLVVLILEFATFRIIKLVLSILLELLLLLPEDRLVLFKKLIVVVVGAIRRGSLAFNYIL